VSLSRFPFLVIFGAFSWRFSYGGFETFRFEIWWGCMHEPFCGSSPCDSPPKSVSKGARFWGFLLSRVRGVLGGISSISLDLVSFSRPNHGYGMPMRYSYYPQSYANPWSESGDRDLEELTRGLLFVSRAQVDRCDRCRPHCWVLLGWTCW
jgi:hypothetical protein